MQPARAFRVQVRVRGDTNAEPAVALTFATYAKQMTSVVIRASFHRQVRIVSAQVVSSQCVAFRWVKWLDEYQGFCSSCKGCVGFSQENLPFRNLCYRRTMGHHTHRSGLSGCFESRFAVPLLFRGQLVYMWPSLRCPC